VPGDAFDALVGTYAARVSSERLPALVATRVVEVVSRDRSVAGMRSDLDHIRAIAEQPASRALRRFIFVWFRVFVLDIKGPKREKVNVRIPIPLPIVGALFPHRLTRQKALQALALAESSEDPATAVADYLDSVMGFEFVRVEDRKGPDRRELVVVGFD
jgi:hypothetical protein